MRPPACRSKHPSAAAGVQARAAARARARAPQSERGPNRVASAARETPVSMTASTGPGTSSSAATTGLPAQCPTRVASTTAMISMPTSLALRTATSARSPAPNRTMPPPPPRLRVGQKLRALAARATEEIEGDGEVLRCQAAFFREAVRGQVIGIAPHRHLADLDQPLAHAPPQIGVGEAERDPELLRQPALGQGAIALDRRKQANDDSRVFGPR